MVRVLRYKRRTPRFFSNKVTRRLTCATESPSFSDAFEKLPLSTTCKNSLMPSNVGIVASQASSYPDCSISSNNPLPDSILFTALQSPRLHSLFCSQHREVSGCL